MHKRLICGALLALFSASYVAAQTETAPCSAYDQSFNIYFDKDSVAMGSIVEALIKQAVDNITASESSCEVGAINIEGHTDTTGSAERNISFSQTLALTVADALMVYGFERDDMIITGHGETRLARQTDDEKSSPLNRRVEVKIGLTAR